MRPWKDPLPIRLPQRLHTQILAHGDDVAGSVARVGEGGHEGTVVELLSYWAVEGAAEPPVPSIARQLNQLNSSNAAPPPPPPAPPPLPPPAHRQSSVFL